MGKCIKFKNLKFKSEEEFESYLMSQFLGVRFKRVVDAKTVSEELDEVGKKIHFDEAKHAYSFGKIHFTSTTTYINESIVGLNEIHNTPIGEASRLIGERYHSIFEHVIKGRNAGLTLNEIIKKNPQIFTQKEFNDLGEMVNSLYNDWTTTNGKPNGNIVKSEFKIANTKAKIAGTIDVAVIHPDGSLDLYDAKGSRFEYGEHVQKLDSNAAQLEIYKTMLEKGDEKLGMLPLKINKTAIIPFFSDIESHPDGDFVDANTGEKFKLMGINFEGLHDTNDKSFFKNKDKIKSIILSVFNPDNGIKVKSLKMKDAPTSQNFSEKISGFESEEEPYDPSDFGDRTDMGLAYKFTHAFQENYQIFNEPKGSNFKQSAQVAAFFNRFDPKNDKMVVANSFPGFENVDPNIIFILKNYDPDTASFTYLDMAYIDLNYENKVQSVDNAHRTIFGQFASDRKVNALAKRVNANGLELYYNNNHSNKAMVMGMLALKMVKLNPDVKIGSIYVDSFPKFSDGMHTIHSMDRILNHLKIMEVLKDENGEPLIKRLPDDIQEIIKDPYFRDTRNYAHNYLENLFHYIISGLKKTEEDVPPGLIQWYEMNLKDMIPSNSNSEQLRKISKDILKSFRKRKELLKFLKQRMDEIRHLKSTIRFSENSAKMEYQLNKEYEMLSDLTVYLYDMIPSIDRITEDMSSFEKFTSSGGMTGIEIVDKFANEVQYANGLLVRDLYNNYVRTKRKHFRKLFGQTFFEKAGDQALGLTSKYFEPLLEEKEFKVKNGGGKTVLRKTMRFWPKDSEQYKALSDTQKEFIEWYNDQVDEYLTTLLPEGEYDIRKYWDRGDIPLVKASSSNIIYKALNRKLNGEDGGYENVFKTIFKRTTDKYKDRTDPNYLGTNQNGDEDRTIDEVNTFFKNQLTGHYDRNRSLGIDENDEVDETAMDHWETNLETILNFAAVGSKKKKYLEPLIPLYYAVKNIIDRAEIMHNKNFKNMREYLEVYALSTLKNIRQKNFKSDALEAFISTASGKASQAVVGWNMFSQLKNAIAGHIHQLSNSVASLGGGDWADVKANEKAFRYVWKNILNSKDIKAESKVHDIMYSLGLTNVDVEFLARDKRFQEGGHYIFGKRKANLLNSAGDYYHRAWISVAQMIKDGTWDAWKFNEKTGRWVYNEDLDPRFKGEQGEAFKKRLKMEMDGEDTLDEFGRMISPYTQRKIESIRKLSNLTYETHNEGGKPILENWILGRVAMVLGGWAFSKRERFYKTGGNYEIMGDYVPETDANGNLTGEFKWNGHYFEGQVQTISDIARSAWNHMVGNEKGSMKDVFNDLTSNQKSNLTRTFFELGVATLIGEILKSWLFNNKKKKKSISYYLMLGSLSEISTINFLTSASSMISSPFPAIGIYNNILSGLFSSNPERQIYSATRFAGPLKIIYDAGRIGKEKDMLN